VNQPTPAQGMAGGAWLDIVDVGLSGVWRTGKAAIPHIIAGGCNGAIMIAKHGVIAPRTPAPQHCVDIAGLTRPALPASVKRATSEFSVQVDSIQQLQEGEQRCRDAFPGF
jgi:hypothetical protein